MSQGNRLRPSDRGAARTFGVEEEFLLLDPDSLVPSNKAPQIIRELSPEDNPAEREFFVSQIETATDVCHAASEAEEALRMFRGKATAVAASSDVMLVGIGLPPVGGDEVGVVTPKLRYQRIATNMRAAGAHQYVTGTHVHVEVPNRDCGVDVLARLARWTPALLALTANSPLWCGELTGFESWRHIKSLNWPVIGYPEGFATAAHYEETVARLTAAGVLLDEGMVTWPARLSHRYPTVEFRLADSQLEAEDAVAYAVLLRALVDRAVREHEQGVDRPQYSPGLVDSALWLAARDGLGEGLVDPCTGTVHDAFEFVEMMVRSVEEELEGFNDLGLVMRYLERRRRVGSPARLQRRHFEEGGLTGLRALYESTMSAPEDAS